MNSVEDGTNAGGRAEARFRRTVAQKQARKQEAQRKGRSFLFWFGAYGLVGWSVAIPTLLGAALGLWLDETSPVGFSWTITLLFVGVVTGCLLAWYWVRRESGHHRPGKDSR